MEGEWDEVERKMMIKRKMVGKDGGLGDSNAEDDQDC